MSKNKKIISLSIDPDLHEILVKLKKKRGESLSSMVTNLVDRFVGILEVMEEGDEVFPLLLKVPEKITDEVAKEEWALRKESTLANFAEALQNSEVIPIVLQIPKSTRNDPDVLRSWLKSCAEAIYEQLSP